MTLIQQFLSERLCRVRCWLRGYHIEDSSGIAKFRYDVNGICYDCGVVGTGIREKGE